MNDKIVVKSMSSGKVIINSPNLRFKREWPRKNAKVNIDAELLKELLYEPGVEYMVKSGLLFIEDMDLLLPQTKRQHISSYLNEEIVLSWLAHHELDYSCFSSNFQPISFLALWKLDMTEFQKNQHLLM